MDLNEIEPRLCTIENTLYENYTALKNFIVKTRLNSLGNHTTTYNDYKKKEFVYYNFFNFLFTMTQFLSNKLTTKVFDKNTIEKFSINISKTHEESSKNEA